MPLPLSWDDEQTFECMSPGLTVLEILGALQHDPMSSPACSPAPSASDSKQCACSTTTTPHDSFKERRDGRALSARPQAVRMLLEAFDGSLALFPSPAAGSLQNTAPAVCTVRAPSQMGAGQREASRNKSSDNPLCFHERKPRQRLSKCRA